MKCGFYITVLFLCKLFNLCLAQTPEGFKSLQYGFRLDRKIIKTFTSNSILDCFEECHRTSRCKSINYYKGANYCEISYENKGLATERFLRSNGWIYGEKQDWAMVHMDFCSGNYCNINETCTKLSMDTFECAISDCGVPEILGVDMNSVGRWDSIGIGGRRRLQCKGQYTKKGSGVIVCQEDGQWSTDILCGLEYQGHFYQFNSQASSWTGAKAHCGALGGYLLEINTDNEWDWIFTTCIVPNFRQDCPRFHDCGTWTGGRRKDEFTFVWSGSGHPLNSNLWYDGQPNNHADQGCVEITRLTGLLNDRGCQKHNPFICEWDP